MRVTDFGADPTGAADPPRPSMTPSSMPSPGQARHHRVPAGRTLVPGRQPKRELYVSNTVGRPDFKVKNIGLLLEDMARCYCRRHGLELLPSTAGQPSSPHPLHRCDHQELQHRLVRALVLDLTVLASGVEPALASATSSCRPASTT